MKYLFIISFLLFSLRLESQTNDRLMVSKTEIKSFLSESLELIIEKANPNISGNPTAFTLSRRFLEHISSMDSFILKGDVDFILTQVNQTKNLTWDNFLLDKVNILDTNSAGKLYEVYAISVPYFSKDRQTCIMNVGQITGKCGRNWIMVLKRRDNKWMLYKKF